jgi:CubicO group peptidase (beta-lactamase class C family)
VVFADYNAPFASTDPHLLASGTKSFSFALFALGVMDGIWSLDEPVFETISEWAGDSRRQMITIRHLLTLSSGLKDAAEYNVAQVPSLDIYDLAINKSTQPYDVDTAFIYGAVNFFVLAAVFERKTGLDPVNYLYERLLSHLGMDAAHTLRWTRDIKGKPQMAGGAWLDARTWLNYGQLMLQNGDWLGQQLLDANLVGLSTSLDNPAYQGYGLTWWRNTPLDGSYNPSTDSVPADARPANAGELIVADLPADLYFAAGFGRQRLYIVPSQNLVIVRFGMTLSQNFSDNELLLRIMGAFE